MRPGRHHLGGGGTAVEHDIREANRHDVKLIVPIVLLVVFLILVGRSGRWRRR